MNFPHTPNKAVQTTIEECFFKLTASNLNYPGLMHTPAGAIHALFNILNESGNTSEEIIQSGNSKAENYMEITLPRRGKHFDSYPLKPHLSFRMLRAQSVDQLRRSFHKNPTFEIFINNTEISPSKLTKGVQPSVPLWLASYMCCIPFDPSSGYEALAIIHAALNSACANDKNDIMYLTMHNDCRITARPLSETGAQNALKGMYRITGDFTHDANHDIRLLGAGKELKYVNLAANILRDEWNIKAEIWSCPSYTRLARDAHEAEQWNMLHPLSEPRKPHIIDCLQNDTTPVIAVTGYTQHISNQIGAFIPARFTALGADTFSTFGNLPRAHAIVASAIKTLVADEKIPQQWATDCLRRYKLSL